MNKFLGICIELDKPCIYRNKDGWCIIQKYKPIELLFNMGYEWNKDGSVVHIPKLGSCLTRESDE